MYVEEQYTTLPRNVGTRLPIDVRHVLEDGLLRQATTKTSKLLSQDFATSPSSQA